MVATVGRQASRLGAHQPLYTSAVLALAIETLLFVGVGTWLLHPHVVPQQRPEPMTITLAPLAPASKRAPVIPKPTPQPVAQTQPRHVVPVHLARDAHATRPKPQPVIPPPLAPDPTPQAAPLPPTPIQTAAPTEPAPATHPISTSTPAAGDADVSFAAALRDAIQAALRYPESARMQGTIGRTLVAFIYRDSAVSDIRVVTSSGMGLLDHAAVVAVRDAACPPPPHGMEGKDLPERLWINFRSDRSE